MRSFPPGLAVDKVTGKGVPVSVGKVLDLLPDGTTGDPVAVFDPEDTVNARLLTTNQAGYYAGFKADADRLQVTFGGVTLFLEAVELYTELKADTTSAASAAMAAATSAQEALNAILIQTAVDGGTPSSTFDPTSIDGGTP